MLQIIIFSFNRAMQLDTLLRSVYKHFKFDNYQVGVLYNTSNRDFEKGYDLLKGKYRHSCISPWQYNHVIQRS